MASLERQARAIWNGDLKGGNGQVTASSGAINDTPYSFGTRFEQTPGTNPEELLAAAHAACFSMAFSGGLGRNGYEPQQIDTTATCYLTPKDGGGFRISKIRLESRGKVDGIDQATFQKVAEESEQNICLVSQALRNNIEIEVAATLL